MNSINKLFDYRRAGYVIAAFAVLLATVLPSLAMAAQVTVRSIQLSSSTVSAANTTYDLSFKAVGTAGAFVIDFCTTPTVGTVCTAPAGLSASSAAALDTAAFTAVTGSANKATVTTDITAGEQVTGKLNGITNPSATGVFYARIITFDTAANAALYDSTATTNNPGTGSTDTGGVAMSITPTIGVSGAVSETLIFCASKAAISAGCTGSLDAPNVVLGTDGVLGTTVSEGTIHSQISTNALSGAVVNLKSDAAGCGGLLRSGAGTATERCGIQPITTAAAIGVGAALFGVRAPITSQGTGAIEHESTYNDTTFLMNFAANELSGVTSTYGDPLYNTDDAPISDGAVDLVFGANIGNDTPAGAYSANLSLIATGKF